MQGVEFDFGDERLNRRADLCFAKLHMNPTLSFPEIFNRPGELQGFYRFVHNEKTELKSIKQSIEDETKRQMGRCKEAIAIHDTTHVKPSGKGSSIIEFNFPKGFFAHASLLIDTSNVKRVYGVAGIHLWNRLKKKAANIRSTGEQERWFNQIKEVEENYENVQLIHVMDREADSCPLWGRLIEEAYRFVIRAKCNRQVATQEGTISRLFDEVRSAPVIATQTVTLSRRTGHPCPGTLVRHPPRDQREVVLNISAQSMMVHKTNKFGATTKETVRLNVVRVFESDETIKNPVEWLLITTESITSLAGVIKIVDIYKARWTIEEFFKGLKSGCQLEARLLGDAESWHKLVALCLPIATSILNLRLVHDEEIKTHPRPEYLSKTQLKILEKTATESGHEIKTYRDAQYEIACLGGHIRANGVPGWITLTRGYKQLNLLERGWHLAKMKRCDK